MPPTVTVMLLMFGALLLLYGFLRSRSATRPAPKMTSLDVQSCGALTIGAAALVSDAPWTAKLPILLSSAILVAMSTCAHARVRHTIQDPD
ncbi:hypothetical protein [Rhodococcus pyridinivorans]|uniref:hypothetical protein n=2 Tax=Rhodococcus pyridinivorans TaxID=103816 RepID=UPI0022835BB4|nr:hypothetical protein [Rhodococcus pyridinivorans]WAL49600.1 hypothetical protein OQN32_27745 [Rhodococcus pyridinivorans]